MSEQPNGTAKSPRPDIEALKQRVEKAGWEHSYGSLHVVYVNDVLDWLDELAASSGVSAAARFPKEELNESK